MNTDRDPDGENSWGMCMFAVLRKSEEDYKESGVQKGKSRVAYSSESEKPV